MLEKIKVKKTYDIKIRKNANKKLREKILASNSSMHRSFIDFMAFHGIMANRANLFFVIYRRNLPFEIDNSKKHIFEKILKFESVQKLNFYSNKT